MASNYIETKHELLLRQLIEEAGLECNIVMEESVGSEILENIVEEEGLYKHFDLNRLHMITNSVF